MADSKVEIKILTSADTSGTQAAVQGMTAVEQAAKHAADAEQQLVAKARAAARELVETAKQAAAEQKAAAKDVVGTVQQAASEKVAAEKQAAQQVVAAAKQAAAEQKAAADSVPPMPDASGGAPGPSGGKAAKSGGRGRALLELGRVVQDAMYGFGGILNNVEGLAQAAGLGSKMAGGFTLAGVALSIFGPQLLEWLSSLDKRGAALNDLVSTLERAKTALGGSNTGNAENAARIAKEQEAAREAEKMHFAAINQKLEDRLKLYGKIKEAEEGAAQRAKSAAAADFAAQKLPKEQQVFETLSRQRGDLDANYQRQVQAANMADRTAADKLRNAANESLSANDSVAKWQKEKEASDRAKRLITEQERIEKALAAAKLITETNVTGPNLAKAEKDVERLTNELEKNREAQNANKRSAPDGNIKRPEDAAKNLAQAEEAAKAAQQKFLAAYQAEQQRKQQAQLDAFTRDDTYRKQAEEIERARRAAMPDLPYLPGAVPPLPAPGETGWGPVIDPKNFRQPWSGMPQVPGAPPAPLPQAFYAPLPPQAQFPQVQMPQVPGMPTQPALPAPGQPTAYSAPQAMPWVPGVPTQPPLPPPPGMGGQSTATADAGPVKTAVDEAAASNEAANQAVIEAMQALAQQNAQLAAKVAQLASQTRNSRGGYS